MRSWSECMLAKGVFFTFLSFVASNQRVLTPSVRQFFVADLSHVLVMFWHDFGQGGRAPWSPCLREQHRWRQRQRLRSQTENGATVKAHAAARRWGRWDSKSLRGGRMASARRVRCSQWRQWWRQVRADADGQGTRAGATTTACNQIKIYKIKK